MLKRSLIVFCFVVVGLALVWPTASQAMPNFARKYGADCSMCHTAVPKLNRIGYEFRLAGFRLPSEIGKDEKPFNLGDFFAARIQTQYLNKTHSDATPGSDSTTDSLEFYEFTMYPLSGSWGKNFGSLTEFSMASDGVFEVENAYVRAVAGNDNGWFQARVGVMHPWEGFGASDRPIGNTRPLFQKTPATGSPFYLWNLDESALEVGYHYAKSGTSAAARVSNGVVWNAGATNHVDPAQGGDGAMATSEKSGYKNKKSYQLFLNQFITDSSSVSLYYYTGAISFPDPSTSPAVSTMDNFTRFAGYANFFVWPDKVNLLAGYAYGEDKLDDGTVAGAANVGKSKGYFGEVDFHASSKLALALRYDSFDPSDKVDRDTLTAYTLSANYHIVNGLQLIADYQAKDTEKATGKNRDNQLTARLIFIF